MRLSDPFRIEFERSGGFAGIPLRSTTDSRELTPDEAREIDQLLEQVDFEALAKAAETSSGRSAADRFQYDLTLERGDQQLHLRLGEQDVPPMLRPLLERLLQQAREPSP